MPSRPQQYWRKDAPEEGQMPCMAGKLRCPKCGGRKWYGSVNCRACTDYGQYCRRVPPKPCLGCDTLYHSGNPKRRFCSTRCWYIWVKANPIFRPLYPMPTRYKRHDLNHHAIADALRQIGAGVLDFSSFGNGVPDLVVGFQGKNYLMEVKNPKTAYGKRGQTKAQKKFADQFPVHVVTSVEEALAVLGVKLCMSLEDVARLTADGPTGV